MEIFNLGDAMNQKHKKEEDPREKEFMSMGVERFNDGKYFALVTRDADGKIIVREITEFLDGLIDGIKKALTDFYVNPGTIETNLEKDKEFLKKQATAEMKRRREQK